VLIVLLLDSSTAEGPPEFDLDDDGTLLDVDRADKLKSLASLLLTGICFLALSVSCWSLGLEVGTGLMSVL
jgi:hypothetical protein